MSALEEMDLHAAVAAEMASPRTCDCYLCDKPPDQRPDPRLLALWHVVPPSGRALMLRGTALLAEERGETEVAAWLREEAERLWEESL